MTPLLQQWLLDHDMLTGRVHHMDALGLLSLLPDASVDLISTDPPFNVDKAAWDSWETVEAFIAWLDDHLREMRRVLKPNGSLYLFCATKYAADVEIAVRKHFNVLNTIRWKKPPFSTKAEMFDKEAMRAYFPASESIIFAEQKDSDLQSMGGNRSISIDDECDGFIFEPIRQYLLSGIRTSGLTFDQIAQPVGVTATMIRHYVRASNWTLPTRTKYEQLRAVTGESFLPMTFNDLAQWHDRIRREYEDLRRPFYATPNSPYTDVWEFPTVNTYTGKHVCEKPLSMAEHIVRISSRPNALVLDPFAGSGNLLRGAFLQGRRYIGGDADRYWAGRANDRVKQPFNLSLFGELEGAA